MAICTFDTPIFNTKSGTLLYILEKDVTNGKVLSDKYSHKKNYSRKCDFS